MVADSESHPSADVLQKFGLGKLTGDFSSMVLSHLEKCASCRKVVASLSGDSFLDRMRAAQDRSVTPMPDKSARELLRESLQTPAKTNIPSLPAELANHPQYEIIKELGRGGMGVVYLARNRQMDRMEVLKVMGQEFLAREGARQRFEREIRSAARLNHPNVVAAYSVLSLESLLVFAMEYVEGEDLAKVVNNRGPLPVANACYCIYQAALGLQHAHEKGMVHRDIKPQNLILKGEVEPAHVAQLTDTVLIAEKKKQLYGTGLQGKNGVLKPYPIADEANVDKRRAEVGLPPWTTTCSGRSKSTIK